MTDTARRLLVHFGDPASLAAAATIRRPERVIVWHPMRPDAASEGRRRAAERTASAIGAAEFVVDDAAWPELPGDPSVGAGELDGASELAVLMRAVAVAESMGAPEVLWPIQHGQIASAVGTAIERVECLLDAMAAGGGEPAVGIDLPVVDLDDDQVVDLIASGGLPWAGAWPCTSDGEIACGSCGGCRRWRRAAAAVGVDDPWAGAMDAVGAAV